MADSCFKFPDHSLAERPRLTRELEPFSNSLPVESPEDHSDSDLRSPLAKRRKTQEKKIIYVPISGNSSQKCEIPPSDHWAWRKYGQKPIKGSPYPRGYYRCSSSKGCSARKQVERSRIDPSMVIITYTTDHNHICPGPHNSEQRPLQAIANHASQDETSCEPSENLFSCIINSPNATDDLMVNSSSLQVEEEEDSSILQRDVDLCLSRSNTEGEDFFADLGELPELAAIFRKGSLEANNSEVSHSNIFDWSSSIVLVENNVMS